MKKYHYLLRNMGFLVLGNFFTKLISFFLIPVYTSFLSTEQYGIYDFMISVVSLLVPVCTLEITGAVLRFSMDKKDSPQEQQEVCRVGIRYLLRSMAVVIILLFVNYQTGISVIIREYQVLFFFSYVGILTGQFVMAYARGTDKTADAAFAGVLGAMVCMGTSICLLVSFRMGLEGYLIANIAGDITAGLYLIFRLGIWRYKLFMPLRKSLRIQMLAYSGPMILTSISWWMNNLSDRYIVTWFCGAAANGVYSVAGKIPQILNLFQQIFYNAWVLSSVKECGEEDSGSFYSVIYNYYNYGMIILCSVLMTLTPFLARILYAKDFYAAWRYVPFLLISIVFGALCGVLNGIFYAYKDTKMVSVSVLSGAAVNTVLNFILIKPLGPLGASMATAAGYAVVWMIHMRNVKQYVKLSLRLPADIIAYILLIIQAFILLSGCGRVWIYGIQSAVLCAIVLLYFRETKVIIQKTIASVFRFVSNRRI